MSSLVATAHLTRKRTCQVDQVIVRVVLFLNILELFQVHLCQILELDVDVF